MPPPNLALSVTRHLALSPTDLWAMGQDVADRRPATLYGRADLAAVAARRRKLEIEPSEPPRNHANIVGWPERKPDQKEIACNWPRTRRS